MTFGVVAPMEHLMIRAARAFAALFAILISAEAAHASPIVATDTVDVAATQGGASTNGYTGATFDNREAGGRFWGDEITFGAQRFDTTQITVNRDNSAHTLTVTLRTMFDGTGPAAYADVYFDIYTPGFDGFGYALTLGHQIFTPGVYSVISSNTANELWYGSGQVYGAYSQLRPSAPGYDANAGVYQYVRLNDGVALPGYDVTTSLTDAGGGFFDLTVEVTSLYGLGLFDTFDLFWATADSGNDAIWGAFVTVPAPAALPTFVFGIFGLGFVAQLRRSRRPLVHPV